MARLSTAVYCLILCWLGFSTSWQVEFMASLIVFQSSFVMVSSCLGRFCKVWNLLMRTILNLLDLLSSERNAVTNFCITTSPTVQCFFGLNFTLATIRWRYKYISVPINVHTCSMDLNILFMKTWLSWFPVLWSVVCGYTCWINWCRLSPRCLMLGFSLI